MSELKACPWCDGKIKIVLGRQMSDIYCNNCGWSMTWVETDKEKIIELLNTHPIEDTLENRINTLDEIAKIYEGEAKECREKYDGLVSRLREAVEEMKAYPLTDVKMSEVMDCIKKHVPELEDSDEQDN